jgi:hypothetical protein
MMCDNVCIAWSATSGTIPDFAEVLAFPTLHLLLTLEQVVGVCHIFPVKRSAE